MNYKISHRSEKVLINHMDNLIPLSNEYNMPKASNVINFKRLIDYSVDDENLIIILSSNLKVIKNSQELVDFDYLFLNKKILLNNDFIRFFNMKILELYYSSSEVQGILSQLTNKLTISENSILDIDFSLTEQVIKNFKYKI